MRVQILKGYVKQHFPATPLLDYALEVEKITTSKVLLKSCSFVFGEDFNSPPPPQIHTSELLAYLRLTIHGTQPERRRNPSRVLLGCRGLLFGCLDLDLGQSFAALLSVVVFFKLKAAHPNVVLPGAIAPSHVYHIIQTLA